MKIIKTKKIVDANAKVDLFSILFSSCLFSGYFPFASGTFGSMFGLLFFLIKGFDRIEVLIPLTLICFIIGIVTSNKMMKRYGDDPSVVVIDEVVGLWITVIVFQFLSKETISISILIILFLSFRFFDIIKLQPARYFDRLHSGWGVMMDDVIAGVYAGILAYLISLFKFSILQ